MFEVLMENKAEGLTKTDTKGRIVGWPDWTNELGFQLADNFTGKRRWMSAGVVPQPISDEDERGKPFRYGISLTGIPPLSRACSLRGYLFHLSCSWIID